MSTEDQTTTLEINRTSIGETRLVSEPHREGGRADGQARLRVDRFALNANNITYAEYAERCADAIVDFAVVSRDWLTVEHHNGAEAAQAAWLDVYAGSVAPSTGVIARIADVG
jgi:hypothetical protein